MVQCRKEKIGSVMQKAMRTAVSTFALSAPSDATLGELPHQAVSQLSPGLNHGFLLLISA